MIYTIIQIVYNLLTIQKHEYVYKQEKANPLQILKSCLLILAVISPEKSQKTHIILIFLLSEKDMVKKNWKTNQKAPAYEPYVIVKTLLKQVGELWLK